MIWYQQFHTWIIHVDEISWMHNVHVDEISCPHNVHVSERSCWQNSVDIYQSMKCPRLDFNNLRDNVILAKNPCWWKFMSAKWFRWNNVGEMSLIIHKILALKHYRQFMKFSIFTLHVWIGRQYCLSHFSFHFKLKKDNHTNWFKNIIRECLNFWYPPLMERVPYTKIF